MFLGEKKGVLAGELALLR